MRARILKKNSHNSFDELADNSYFNSVVINNPSLILCVNQQLEFLGCSPTIEKIGHFNQATFVSAPIDTLLNKLNFSQLTISKFRTLLQQLFNEKTAILQNEVKYPPRSFHKSHYFQINLYPINIPHYGLAALVQATDITNLKIQIVENKRTRVILKRNADKKQRYLENIIGCMPGQVFWTDKNSVFQGCNDNAATIVGLENRSGVIGKTYEDFATMIKNHLSLESIQQFRRDDQEVIQTGIPKLNIEDPLIIKADGSHAYFLSSRVPLFEEGKVVGVVGISLDITDLKKAREELRMEKEKAEIATQAKSEFLASMSHDLRTPLNGILGIAQILMTKGLNREQTEYVSNIVQAGNTLLQIIEDILSFSRVEAGKFELSIEPFNLRQLLEEIVDLVSIQANKKNIKIYYSYDENAPYYVIGDLHCTRRIIINLIDNAIKFTDKGYVLVSVEPITTTAQEATLQIAIEDTGIGIPPDKINYVFERFNRLTPSYKGRYKGTGLGLTIVKQLIEVLGGSIHVNSQPGKGSTFWFELPFKLQDKKVSVSNWARYYQHIPLLIIDDYDIRAEIRLKELSSSHGLHVHSSNALEVLKAETKANDIFKIIMIDDELKDMTPMQLAKVIREIPIYKKTLLILCSNPCSLEQIDKAKKAGFHGIFNKAMQPAELLNKLTFSWESWMYALLDRYKAATRAPIFILLIEDDFLSQKVTRIILEDMGCTVEIAGDGKTALSLINKKHFLILVDIGLPDIDGITLTEKIRTSDSPDKSTPIVALTAHVMENETAVCIKAGMNYFMKKPLMKHELLQILLDVVPTVS